MMLTDLADVLRAGGLRVVEVPGWQTRGHGPMVDVKTIICHHTAGLNDMRTIRDGRPGLDGPLAQVWLSRQGVFWVVAAGLCWHAGVSRDPSYTNAHAIGFEAEALGTGAASDWPSVQMDAYVTGARVLADHYRVPHKRVLGHKETCAPVGRKSDPSFDMGAFRARLKEDDMPTADEIADAVVAKMLAAKVKANDGTVAPLAAWWVYGNIKAGQARDNALRAQNAANSAVSAAQAVSVTAAQAAADAVRQAIADGVVSVDVNVKGEVK